MRITTRRERERLARECGTTVAYLYQLAGGHRRAGAALALKLERATSGAICRCNMRPDLFPPEECACRRTCTCPSHTPPAGPLEPPAVEENAHSTVISDPTAWPRVPR